MTISRLWELELSFLVGLIVLFLLGYAASPFLLPKPWRRWRILAAPTLGLVLFSVLSYWVSMYLPIGYGIWIILGIGIIGSILAFLKDRKSGIEDIDLLETCGVICITGIAVVVAATPAILKSELLATGPNWDFEIYLPLAEYLKDYPLGLSWDSPAGQDFPQSPNPLLWRINFFDTRWAGLAFSLFHAGVNSIAKLEAHQSFSALLALVFSCSIPAVYIFYRSVLSMRRGLSLAGAAIMSINSAALFTVFWSFGQQASSIAILPLAIAAAIEADKRPDIRTILLAGLSLAALINCFTPITLVYASVVALAYIGSKIASRALPEVLEACPEPGRRGTARPFESLKERATFAQFHPSWVPGQVWAWPISWLIITRKVRDSIKIVVALLAVSIVFNPWGYLRTIVRATHFLSEGGTSGLTVGPDVEKYPPLAWAYGLVADRATGLSDTNGSWLGGLPDIPMLLVGIALLFTTAAVLKKGDYLLASCALGALIPLFLLRWPFGYPYGYLKLLPSVAFIMVGVAISSIDYLLGRTTYPAIRVSPLRWVALGLVLLYAGTTFTGIIGTLRVAMKESTLSYRSLEEIRRQVSPDHSIYIPFHSDLQGPKAAAVAYFLRDAQLYGQLRTGYSTFYRLSTEGVYDFALLSERDGRLGEVVDQSDVMWRGSGLVLYKWKADIVAYQELGPVSAPPIVAASGGRGNASGVRIEKWDAHTGYPNFQGWSPPLLGVLADTSESAASYPVATSTSPITIGTALSSANRHDISLPHIQGRYNDKDSALIVTLAATSPTGLQININGSINEVDLPPGVTSLAVGKIDSQTAISLSPKEDRVFVKSLQLTTREAKYTEEIIKHEEMAVVEWQNNDLGLDRKGINISYAGPALKPVLDIYRNPKEGDWHFGYWEVPISMSNKWDTILELDLKERTVTDVSNRQSIPGWVNGGPEGNYIAYLFLWDGLSVSKSVPITDFHLADSSPTNAARVPLGSTRNNIFIG